MKLLDKREKYLEERQRIATNRRLISAINEIAGVSDAEFGKQLKSDSLFHPIAPLGEACVVAQNAAKDIRNIREGRRFVPEHSYPSSRVYDKYKPIIRAALQDWRPAFSETAELIQANHSRDITLVENKNARYWNKFSFRYPLGLAKRREDSGVPWVATDRFVLTVGKLLSEPLPDGMILPCLYIEPSGFTLVNGFITNCQGFYGCATRDFDAKKAAKMKAVRHVKQQMGVL